MKVGGQKLRIKEFIYSFWCEQGKMVFSFQKTPQNFEVLDGKKKERRSVMSTSQERGIHSPSSRGNVNVATVVPQRNRFQTNVASGDLLHVRNTRMQDMQKGLLKKRNDAHRLMLTL